MCQVPMTMCSSFAAGMTCPPTITTNSPSEHQRSSKRDWMSIPLFKEVEGRYAFEAIISVSAIPTMDSGTISFIVLAAGMLGYLRIRKRYKFGFSINEDLLANGQKLLQRWQKYIRAKLAELFSRPDPPDLSQTIVQRDIANIHEQVEQSLHNIASENHLDQHISQTLLPTNEVPETKHNSMKRSISDGPQTVHNHQTTAHLELDKVETSGHSLQAPPQHSGMTMQDHLRHNLGDAASCDISDDGEELLSRRTPSPFHRFYNRLPGFPSWTVVNQSDVPSPPPTPSGTHALHDDVEDMEEEEEAWDGADVVDAETVIEDGDNCADPNMQLDSDEDEHDPLDDIFTTEEVEIEHTEPDNCTETCDAASASRASPTQSASRKWFMRPFSSSQ